MALPIFSAFQSTVTRFLTRPFQANDLLLTNPVTGAPTGIRSANANGPDARFVPIDLTAAQIQSPSAAMLADLDATYRLNATPYTRYRSTGSTLVSLEGDLADGSTYPGVILQKDPPGAPQLVIGPDSYINIWAPWTIQSANGVVVQGNVKVKTEPA